jgi:hypothetical protein
MNVGGRNMSQVSRQALIRGILCASAVALTSGAVQFASGRDLGSLSQASVSQVALISAGVGVDRTAKGDRAASMSVAAGRTQTIALRLEGLSDTSVLVSVPVAQVAHDISFGKAGDRKLACEPVVSVLTEVAKRLEPGRCVT